MAVAMLRIYHVTGTRGTRVIWLCEELGLDYEVETIDFSADYRATPEWRALNPVGKVPVMTDGDVTLFESGAMVEFLLARYAHGRLVPAVAHPDFPVYQQWLWFAEATFARPLGELVNHAREFPGDQQIAEVRNEMAARARVCLEAVADYMAQREFLCSEFSAADVMMGYTLMLAELLLPDPLPERIMPYWERLGSRPAFQIAMAA